MKNADIYAKLIVASIKAKMEYKVAFLFMLVALIFFYLGQIGVVLVTLSRFNTINGWTIGEMAFLYGLLVFSQAIATLFFSSLTGFETHVIEGTFDRLLLRPLSPLGQIMANNFEIGSLAHFIIGVTALYYGSMLAGVEWSIANGLFFAVVMTGAVMIHGGIRIAVSAVAFWTLRNRSLVHIFVFSSKELILYPVSIFSHWVQLFLTIIFPIAFINFYPSHHFLNRDPEGLLFHPTIQYMTPVVGVLVLSAALLLWRRGINHYQSVGN